MRPFQCNRCLTFLLVVLVLSGWAIGCGLDFGPGRIAGLGSEEFQDSTSDPNTYIFSETGVPGSLSPAGPELRCLPTAYRRFLDANPDVARNLIWVDEGHLDGQSILNDETRVRDLIAHLTGEIRFEAPPVPAMQGNDGSWYFLKEDAWNMYLAHVAHALKVEVHNLVPWSLTDYSEDELALLFDSRYYVAYEPSTGLYRFSLAAPGGRHGVTDWSPEVAYDFLVQNDVIATRAGTVYNFTNWVRQNLVHRNNTTPPNWDGYPGLPPIEAILHPPGGERHWTGSCWATTSLYIAVLQSVNIPVRRGVSFIATQGGQAYAHSRVELPSLGFGLAHADESHCEINRRGTNEVPVEHLFYRFDELTEYIDEPFLEDGAPGSGEQAGYNMLVRTVDTAFRYRADSILKRRARDLLGHANNSLENLLTGAVCDFSQCFWKPLFEQEERQVMLEEIDTTLTAIGSGDILRGARQVISR